MQSLLWESPIVPKPRVYSPKLTNVEISMVERYCYGVDKGNIPAGFMKANSRSLESSACQKWQKIKMWSRVIDVWRVKHNRDQFESLVISRSDEYSDRYGTNWCYDLMTWESVKSGNPCDNIERLSLIYSMWDLLGRVFWVNAMKGYILKEKLRLEKLKDVNKDWIRSENKMLAELSKINFVGVYRGLKE